MIASHIGLWSIYKPLKRVWRCHVVSVVVLLQVCQWWTVWWVEKKAVVSLFSVSIVRTSG